MPPTTYRLAPALGARLVGRTLVTLAGLVLVTTVVSVLTGAGWVPAGVVTLVGVVAAGLWAWYLLKRAWAVRLSSQGYAVRLLGGIGASSGAWRDVDEVLAATRAGTPYLVIRQRDGRETRLPMTAVAGDADAFADDVRRRVRDTHTS